MARAKLNPVDFRPVVKIFGKDYKLPYYASIISDIPEENIVDREIRRVIDAAYPGIKRPEAHMLYLHMISETRKKDGVTILPKEREIKLSGQIFKVSFEDITFVQQSVFVEDGIEYHFKQPSLIEILDNQLNTPRKLIDYCLDYMVVDGVEYDLAEGAYLPLALTNEIEKIQGTLQLVLKTGETITGFDRIQELFISGKFL